jgi:hypothetical protein
MRRRRTWGAEFLCRLAAFFAGENRLMAVIVIDVRACGANNATIRVLPAYQHVC